MTNEATISCPTWLTKKTRQPILNALQRSAICGGNQKVPSKGAGLSEITTILSDLGYSLDMVYADDILGDKGHRLLTFRPLADPDNLFTEFAEIENVGISFSWENIAETGETPNFEIIAYVS